MKWIIGIFILLDSFYQIFGVSTSVEWSVFYELIHYGVLLAVCLFYGFKSFGSSIMKYFSLYFVFIIGITLSYIGASRAEYLENSRVESVLYITYFIIFVLLLFLIKKTWENFVTTGRYY